MEMFGNRVPFFRSAAVLLLLSLVAIASGCGGGGTSPPSSEPPPSGLSYPSPQVFTVGVAITTLSPTVTGSVTSYAISPALSAGVSLNSTTRQITGTPTTVMVATSYTITAQNISADGIATAFRIAREVSQNRDIMRPWMTP